MKFRFTDDELKDTWEEWYKSEEEISKEILQGCSCIRLYPCAICDEDFEDTKDYDEKLGICNPCKEKNPDYIKEEEEE